MNWCLTLNVLSRLIFYKSSNWNSFKDTISLDHDPSYNLQRLQLSFTSNGFNQRKMLRGTELASILCNAIAPPFNRLTNTDWNSFDNINNIYILFYQLYFLNSFKVEKPYQWYVTVPKVFIISTWPSKNKIFTGHWKYLSDYDI